MTTLMKKIDFARRCNVDRSRVTQWCKAGQISGAAIVARAALPCSTRPSRSSSSSCVSRPTSAAAERSQH